MIRSGLSGSIMQFELLASWCRRCNPLKGDAHTYSPCSCIAGQWLCSVSDVSRQHWIACAQAVLMLPGNTGLATQTTAGETAGTENTCEEQRHSGWRWVWGWSTWLLHKVQIPASMDVFPQIILPALLLSQQTSALYPVEQLLLWMHNSPMLPKLNWLKMWYLMIPHLSSAIKIMTKAESVAHHLSDL